MTWTPATICIIYGLELKDGVWQRAKETEIIPALCALMTMSVFYVC